MTRGSHGCDNHLDFALRYEPNACQRVLDLTQRHPFLVQLPCAEIVTLKNEQPLAGWPA